MRTRAPLGGMTASNFLKRHWQKSPHLFHQAFPGFVPPVTAEELAGLAGEANVESRLIIRTHGKPGWRVLHGPFTAKDFRRLPPRNWTLLVQDCDKHIAALARFLGWFSFIPNWRIDDLMISYAVEGGSVGPHVDAYDVFLLQAQGRRHWNISRKPQPPLLRPGLDLKMVRAFKPEHSWTLEPGDMLYLPPGVAHHGVALGEGLTFSIGFRAPSDKEVSAEWNHSLLQRLDDNARYADPDLRPASADPGLISKSARARMRRRLRNAQRLSNAQFDAWFGCYVTEPKPWLMPTKPRRPLSAAALRRRLVAVRVLERAPAAKVAWFPATSAEIKLFINGHCRSLPRRLTRLIRLLCGPRIYTAAQLEKWLRNREGARLITELYNSGILQWP